MNNLSMSALKSAGRRKVQDQFQFIAIIVLSGGNKSAQQRELNTKSHITPARPAHISTKLPHIDNIGT